MPRLPYPAPGETEHDLSERDTLILEDESLKHGFIQLPKVILRSRHLSRDAKLLYAILLSYTWDDDHCFPGYARLCEDMQASENMVRKYMRELMAVGLLSQKRRGLGKTNLYFMHEIRTSQIAVQEDHKVAAPNHAKTAGYVDTEDQESKTKSTYLRKEETFEKKEDIRERELDQTTSHEIQTTPSSPFDIDPDTLAPPAVEGERGSDSQPLAALLARRAPKHDASREDRAAIAVTIQRFAGELGDTSPKSSVTRAINLFQQSQLSRDRYLDLLFRARATTREKRGRMGYFFGVLEKWLTQQAVT